MEDIYQELGDAIKRLRKDAGLTQGQLADMVGIHQTELSAFENSGSRIRGADRINQILAALGYELQIGKKKLQLA